MQNWRGGRGANEVYYVMFIKRTVDHLLSLRINFVLEPRDQRFPGSLSLSLRRVGRREPWERGCHLE